MMIFSPLLEKMFANRGYTESFLTTYEQYDPSEQMLNARAFCERLRELRLDPACPHIVFMLLPDIFADQDGALCPVLWALPVCLNLGSMFLCMYLTLRMAMVSIRIRLTALLPIIPG